MNKNFKELLLHLIDLFLALLATCVLFILLTGGGQYNISGIQLSMRHIATPIAALYIFCIVRFLISKDKPFLGIHNLNLNRLHYSANEFFKSVYNYIKDLERGKVLRIIIIAISISIIIKVLNSYFYFGFFSGDDVEIHEMTFSHLYNWDWQAWNMRNAIFPMIFIYPIQVALFSFGINDPAILIFAGRLIVVIFSVFNLLLIYKIATHLFKSVPIGILSVCFLALSKLHTTFASSELPRTVSSTFILLCLWFILLGKEKSIFIPAASVSLAIGAALRYGEIIFLVPALLYLAFERRFRQAFVLAFSFIVAFVLIIGLSDKLYWGEPFYSLRHIIDYTLIKKMSSRGYEPFYYYIINVGKWCNFFFIGLALFSLKLKKNKMVIWVFIPLTILSFLPHKEPRYLVPVIPFFAIMAGLSFWYILEKIYLDDFALKFPIKASKLSYALIIVSVLFIILSHKEPYFLILAIVAVAIIILPSAVRLIIKKRREVSIINKKIHISNSTSILLVILLGIIIFEIDGFHFKRSESAVDIARYLSFQSEIETVAIEQIWKAGGKLYLRKIPKIKDINTEKVQDKQYIITNFLKANIQWIAFRNETVNRYSLDILLINNGYEEVILSRKRQKIGYRLFRKSKSNKTPAFR